MAILHVLSLLNKLQITSYSIPKYTLFSCKPEDSTTMLRRRGKKQNKKSDPVVYASPSPNRSLFSSWFSKFKKSNRHGPDPEVDDGGSRFSPLKIGNSIEVQRCGGDDEGFWRLSFGKDGEGEFQSSVCKSCLSIVEGGEGGAMKFNEMVSNVRRMRELEKVERNFADIKLNVKERQMEKEPSLRTPRRIKTRIIQESREALDGTPSRNDTDRECPLDGRESQRKSMYLTREVSSPRGARRRSRHVKVSSPRLNSIVNVRKSKKGRDGWQRDSGEKDYERCAVVKCSYDPQGDFRESMMEMITARGIGGTAAEMEELLACYLMLNDDACHEVIIKVFRQVWFELDGQGFWGNNNHDALGEDQQRAMLSSD